MSKLEEIVPPLELCRKIPAGEFKDSVLVWRKRIGNISRDDRVKVREPEDISYKNEFAEVNYFPAPTLAEIMAELPEGTLVMMDAPGVWTAIAESGTTNVKIEKDSTPATAALRLWLKIKGSNR